MLFHKEKPDLRLQALNEEYENYRRRTKQELADADACAARRTAAALLGVYDDLQRALAQPCTDEAYYHGIRLICENLLAAFAGLGIVPMQSEGKLFNPAYHEAVGTLTDPNRRAEEIVQVVQTGFTMEEEVLRHAKVIVANCE